MRVIGDERALALAGMAETPDGGGFVVSLGPSDDATVQWLSGGVQAGGSLWRRAPWPVADGLFELGAPAPEAGVLVVGHGDSALGVVTHLKERAIACAGAESLDAEALAAASCVVFASEPGSPLPADGFAPLAAGRVMLGPRFDPGFGLEPGVHYLASASPDGLANLAEAVLHNASAFDSLRAIGRIAVEPQRASIVYPRLAADWAAELGRDRKS